jgi:hypothetical protein
MKNPHKAENLRLLKDRTVAREAELNRVEREAFANFSGSFDDLEAALGMLRLGDHVGWRVLVLIHNKRTIRKYEEILNIRVRDFFEAETASSKRSLGYKVALQLGNFWKAVSGALKVPERREIAARVDREA